MGSLPFAYLGLRLGAHYKSMRVLEGNEEGLEENWPCERVKVGVPP